MRRAYVIAVLAALVIGIGSSGFGVSRPLIIHVETAPLAWADTRLPEELMTALSRHEHLTVVNADQTELEQPPLPDRRYDPEAWLDWGTEIGGRYLLVVTVDREELDRRKTFYVPLIFQRWETIAVLAGEMRLYDLQKRRQLTSESFKEELSGADQFQGSTDKNRNDPGLHIPASEKSRLFHRLERALAEKLFERVSGLTRGY